MHACTGADIQIDLYMYTLPTPPLTSQKYPLPHLKPDGQSKLQSCGTLKAWSISPRDSDFPAELFTCTTMAHSHSIWCYVLGRDRGRQTDREEARERERAGTETQLPTVEWYCTVYKRPKETLKRDLKASVQSTLYLCLSKSASHFYSSWEKLFFSFNPI